MPGRCLRKTCFSTRLESGLGGIGRVNGIGVGSESDGGLSDTRMVKNEEARDRKWDCWVVCQYKASSSLENLALYF